MIFFPTPELNASSMFLLGFCCWKHTAHHSTYCPPSSLWLAPYPTSQFSAFIILPILFEYIMYQSCFSAKNNQQILQYEEVNPQKLGLMVTFTILRSGESQ